MKNTWKENYGPIIATILILVFVLYVAIDSQKIREYHKDVEYMNDYINIKLYTKSPRKAKKALQEIEKIYQKYDRITDRTKEYKDVYNPYFIRTTKRKNMDLEIDSDLYEMLVFGKKMYEIADGSLNISAGDVTDIWNQEKNNKEKNPEAYTGVVTDINQIEFLSENVLRNNHVNINVGPIRKGFASEKVRAYLEKAGIDSYLINTGGTILAGNHYDAGVYTIGLEEPHTAGAYYKNVTIKNQVLSTKSIGDKTPIVNPKTYTQEKKIKAVTAIGENGAKMDALSSILITMDEKEGKAFLEKYQTKDKKQPKINVIWYQNDGKIVEESYRIPDFS